MGKLPFQKTVKDLITTTRQRAFAHHLLKFEPDLQMLKDAPEKSEELFDRMNSFFFKETKDLHGVLNSKNQRLILAYGINHGFLSKGDIPEEVLPHLKGFLE